MLGELARLDGDYPKASRLYEECLSLSIEMGNRQTEAKSLGNLSYVTYHQGNFNQAIEYCKKAVVLIGPLQAEYASAVALAIMAGPIGAKGDSKLAARLLAASEAKLDIMGARVQPADKIEIDRYKEAAMEQLGEAEFNKAWTEGQAMSFEEAVAEAMGGT